MIGRILVSFALLALTCASCAPNSRDTTLFQRSGRQKAIVAVMPVINRAENVDLAWDLSHEFTEEICKRMYESPKVYLLRDYGTREIAERLNTPNPAMIPAAATENLGATEFIVVTELIDQKQRPRPTANECVVNLSMRVRVLDIRQSEPKVILQELVNHESMIQWASTTSDYNQTPWGTEAFNRTPLGVAHNKLVREVVSRVENYIEAVR